MLASERSQSSLTQRGLETWQQIQEVLLGFLSSFITPGSIERKARALGSQLDELVVLLEATEEDNEAAVNDLKRRIRETLGGESPYAIRDVSGMNIVQRYAQHPLVVSFLLAQAMGHAARPMNDRTEQARQLQSGMEYLFRYFYSRFWGEPNINMPGLKGAPMLYELALLIADDKTAEQQREAFLDSFLLMLQFGADLNVFASRNQEGALHRLAISPGASDAFMAVLHQINSLVSEDKWDALTQLSGKRQTPVSLLVYVNNARLFMNLVEMFELDTVQLGRILSTKVTYLNPRKSLASAREVISVGHLARTAFSPPLPEAVQARISSAVQTYEEATNVAFIARSDVRRSSPDLEAGPPAVAHMQRALKEVATITHQPRSDDGDDPADIVRHFVGQKRR